MTERRQRNWLTALVWVGIVTGVTAGLYAGSYLATRDHEMSFRGVRYWGFEQEWKVVLYRPLARIEAILSGQPTDTTFVHVVGCPVVECQ